MKNMSYFRVLALLAGLLAFKGMAYATECDITTLGSSCGPINGALFYQADPKSTGTGVFPAFVRIEKANPQDVTPVVEAYNTTVDNVFNNKSDDPHNHQLFLVDIPVVEIDGTNYYEFVLDINQEGKVGDLSNQLTLDEIQIFQSNTPNDDTESILGGIVQITGAGAPVYRLDANEGSTILLDNKTQGAGSGDGDMFLYVPVSVFNQTVTYVYLYSRFGGDTFGGSTYPNNDGFEEWAHRQATTPVPEPATLILLGTGLLGVASKVRRRMKKS